MAYIEKLSNDRKLSLYETTAATAAASKLNLKKEKMSMYVERDQIP